MLEKFCETVAVGVDSLTFGERQELLRLVVERILLEGDRGRVEAVIPLDEELGVTRAGLRPPRGYAVIDRGPQMFMVLTVG